MEESNTAIKQPQGEQAEAELKYSVWKDFKIGLRIVISVPLSQRYRVKHQMAFKEEIKDPYSKFNFKLL